MRGRLDPRGSVDEITGHHALALGADRHGRLAGEDTGARLQCRVEPRDRLDEIESGAHRPLGVVLGGSRRAPDGHDGVADELLDRPAVAADQRARELEVAREQVTRLLRITAFGERGEPDEIGEEHRDEPSLGSGDGGVAAPVPM